MTKPDDIRRLEYEYARRSKNASISQKYAVTNRAYRFLLKRRISEISKFFNENNLSRISGKRILEIGCGSGDAFNDLSQLGAEEVNYFGVDLLMDRLEDAKVLFPSANFICCDARNLPFANNQFEICCQFTAFSSILDSDIKNQMADEMLRLVKAEGFILWYDFIWNPFNKQTKGIRLREICRLFSNCEIHHHRITLAPPLTKLFILLSQDLCEFLEKVRILNSHILALIRVKKTAA